MGADGFPGMSNFLNRKPQKPVLTNTPASLRASCHSAHFGFTALTQHMEECVEEFSGYRVLQAGKEHYSVTTSADKINAAITEDSVREIVADRERDEGRGWCK